MKTAVIIDMDNIHENDIDVALTFYTPDTKFFAVGVSALNMKPVKGNSPLNHNKNKFARIRNLLQNQGHQLEMVPNNVCMSESSDIKIAQVMGSRIMREFDQCIAVSNDHSIVMMSIMLQQVMPTWVMITRPEHGTVLRKTNHVMHGVPIIKPKRNRKSVKPLLEKIYHV